MSDEVKNEGERQAQAEAASTPEPAPAAEPAPAPAPEQAPDPVAPAAETAPEPADEPVSAPAPEPPVIRRQSLALRGGTCDMRVGTGAVDRIGVDLRGTVGKPRLAFVVVGSDVPAEVVERVRRSLVDIGFATVQATLLAGRAARALDAATGLYRELDRAGVNADDAIVAVGDADVISASIFVASTWCGGCVLAAVPTTLDGVVDVTVTPRALDIPGGPDLVRAKGNIRLCICDLGLIGADAKSEGTLMGRAVMVAGAITAGEHSFSELAVRADGIVAGDAEALADEALDISKARCRIASSSAIAIRQGMAYGLDLARALRACLPADVPGAPGDAALLAEGMRISARLAAGREGADEGLLDLVFAQDGLLEKFGLPEVPCDVDPAELLAALKATARRHSNRLMPALPLDYGRVRLTSVEEETLALHLKGWCKSRRKLWRRLERASH